MKFLLIGSDLPNLNKDKEIIKNKRAKRAIEKIFLSCFKNIMIPIKYNKLNPKDALSPLRKIHII